MLFCLPRDIVFPSRRGCTLSGQTELRAGGRGGDDGKKMFMEIKEEWEKK